MPAPAASPPEQTTSPDAGTGLFAHTPPSPQALRWLLHAALPDKSRHKAAGWWQQVDFLVTRSHVDEDGDAFHDGLFISDWKRHDFWLALPDSAPPPSGAGGISRARNWLQRLAPAPRANAWGLLCQWRSYDAAGQPGAWSRLEPEPEADSAAAAAHDTAPDAAAPGTTAAQALLPLWQLVLHYWRTAEHERRSGRLLRARLHASLTPERVMALVQLPLFTDRLNDWSDPERAGLWLDDTWAGARAPGWHGGRRQGAALKLSWRNGQERPGDAEDDAHASYQIEVLADDAPLPSGTAHPPGLALSYSQRQSQARTPLPADAALHLQQLCALFTEVEQRLLADQAQQEQRLHAGLDTLAPTPLEPALLPPLPPHASDAEVLGPQIMALSRVWQEAGRSYAAAVRARWAGQADRIAAADDAASDAADGAAGAAAAAAPQPPQPPAPQEPPGPPAPAVRDTRTPLQAASVLRLRRRIQALGDAGLSERLHQRFVFAPAAYAAHAARHGLRVQALRWQADGALLCWLQPDASRQWPPCWRIAAQGLDIAPVDEPPPAPPATTRATWHDVVLQADAGGDLAGHGAAGQTLWRHHLGATPTCLALAPDDGGLLAVGTQAGHVVLLRKRAAPDALAPATSRYQEVRRILFWDDAGTALAW